MARFAADSRDRVRDAVDMVDLVSKRTELRRAGADHYSGLCPFHEERTPSFGISPSKKVYHCFGCGASGDCFNFVMETEGLDFPGALEALADRYGVQLEREEEDPRAAERRRREGRLLELLDRTADYYARYLWDSDEAAKARAYLEERGLRREVLEAFRVGYAPSAWDKVITGSLRRGFSSREVYDAGLAARARGDGRLFDRFRGRIMFPLADRRGRVRGFGARALRDNQQPKYLNTSENEVFHKGHQLFGAHLARAEAARAGSVIVAEGYTDVLALHQAGMANAVAIMGTALTAEQVGELAQLAPVVLLALDADRAGREAMLRARTLAARRQLELRVVRLPAGSDPADLIAERGEGAMRELVERSEPFVSFMVDQVLDEGPLDSAEARDRAVEELRPILGGMPPSILREELVRRVADRLDLAEHFVAALTEGPAPAAAAGSASGASGPRGPGEGAPHGGPPGGGAASAGAGAAPAAPRPLGKAERTERAFLVLCIAQPERGREALRRVDPEQHFAAGRLRRAAVHLRDHLTSPLDDLPPDDDELRELVAELVVRAEREPASPSALEVQTIALERARLEREIAAAQSAGADVTTLAAQRTELKQRYDRAVDDATRDG